MANISKIASEAANIMPPNKINSDDYLSDSSGNHSDHDEVNKLEKIRKRIIAGEKFEEINKGDDSSERLSDKKSGESFANEMSDEGESSMMEQVHLKKTKKQVLSKKSNDNVHAKLKLGQSKSTINKNGLEDSKKDSLEN